MNLEELREVQADERGTDSLQPLRTSFYRDAAAYLDELRQAREQAAATADDPFDSETVRRLTDEIATAEEVVEAIYERRVGKVVKRASLAAADMPADDEGLTAEEASLFEDLVDRIEANRQEVLDAFESRGHGSATPDAPRELSGSAAFDQPPDTDDGPDTMADEGGVPSEQSDGPRSPPSGDASDDRASSTDDPAPSQSPADDQDSASQAADIERVTIRITRDVGEIFGIDERTYDLESDDVVTLPAANAQPLLDRDAARRIDS